MFFLGIALPDQEFSEMENRYLQNVPKFSMERFESGRYMKEMENYISDHIIMRDQWVGLKASFEVLTGKKENNEVLAVAICYDSKLKEHSCKIEKV